MNFQRVISMAVGLTAGICTAAPSDWPCFRGPNRDGTLAEKLTLVSGEPEVLWRAKVGQGNASMAVVAGRLFTAASGSAESLICLDALTGKKIWAVSDFHTSGNSTPSVEGGRVFALVNGRTSLAACCVAAEDGKVLWNATLPKGRGTTYYGLSGSPRVWDDLVFLNVAGGAAVRKDSGEVAWAHEGHTAYATPIVFNAQGKPAVAFFTGDQLIARDARSGDQLWTIPWKTELHVNACDPIFLGQRVFMCSAYGRGRSLYDVSGASPRTLWEKTENGSGHSYASGFARGEDVFFFTGGNFARLDLASGELLWESPGADSALLIGGALIQLSGRGELAAGPLDAGRKFSPALRAQVVSGPSRNVPAYWDGRLYVRNEAGDLICLRVGK